MTPADTRELLISAAAGLVSSAGLGEATTMKVARRAGVAEGTIYRHFPSKEALVGAVFARAWARLDEDLEASLPPRTDPAARLKAWAGTALGLMRTHPQEAALLRAEFAHLVSGARGGCPAPAGSVRFVEILEESIRLAQKAGKSRPGLDPRACALFIYNGVSKTWATTSSPAEMRRLVSGIQAFLEAAFFP